ncbi:hydantoinase B/oxoprolinase family protein [Kyrpidia sp.]|uniref:hydantoinase B/oxoprolinase family protein n=1 Tax=Kyrpidia sp. TaxID=2073077 RepID=UPI00258B084D|nr:hydantoinase B/oxoprolinase family protein [Kyrpidia sp.]MCL6575042.1 hydantoinase B/oxoprolinase family protein [Kyrpidia sp.]
MTQHAHVDPITYEIVRHKLWSINEEGSATMIHVSGSPVVHATDYNFGIYTSDGEMAVIGVYLLVPIYTGSMAIREFIHRFENIEPGDVFIINNPYLAAEHQNDVQFCAPFFYKGELVAWTGCMAHQVDLGGMEPGSWCPRATDVFQEGLLIPPAKIVSAGKVNQDLWNIIIENSRMPFTVSNDFTAFLAAHRVAQERLTQLCDRYGGDTVRLVMKQSIEESESGLRNLLRSLPDGVFEHTSFLDQAGTDEILTVHCRMTKKHDQLIFDFNGSSLQTTAYGNATRAGTVGAVATLMLALFGSELPWNHGLMRPVQVLAEDGLCVTAIPPAPVSGGAAGANWVAMCAAAGCISKMVSLNEQYASLAFGPGDGSWQLAQFGGLNQYGEPFAAMYLDSLLWGGPAFSFRDGVDSGGAMVILGGGTEDVEQQELLQPLMYLWRREVPDSGGAGKFRGGNGIEFALTPIDTDEVVATLATHGVKVPLRTGIFGGYPGSCARYELVRNTDLGTRMARGIPIGRLNELNGEYELLSSVTAGLRLKKGDVVNIFLQNGGGYGDPLDRDPVRVLTDVLNGAVTPEWARKLYGVVVDSGRIDEVETRTLRETLKRERLLAMSRPASASKVDLQAPIDHHQHLIWGDSLALYSVHEQTAVHCRHCNNYLGELTDDWKALVGVIRLNVDELGPFRAVDERLAVEQYVCPQCGASLWVDVVHSGLESRNRDFSISLTSKSIE